MFQPRRESYNVIKVYGVSFLLSHMIYKSYFFFLFIPRKNKWTIEWEWENEVKEKNNIRNILMSNPIWFSEILYGQANYVDI